ncbi:MAG: hypothetical protein SPJ84_05745 [Fusobacterium gastrosuis]|uniref:hypothetical protein n=2 Tax=Fusobacterium gastrosuis TaxID=1755100 RepID=UPI002A99C651|nr:hypothetical protein [Fusobacterium gastrosuis]
MTLRITSLAEEEEYTTENLNKLADMIWSRNDTIMFVLGSNPCIRTIYLKSISEEKTHQFSYCHIHKIDYILGKAEEKIKNKLLKILEKNKKAKIFIYTSCMEIVTAIDFEKIIERIEKIEKNVKIFVIRRGPMVKRYLSPKESLEKILKELDVEETKIEKNYEEPIFAGEVEIFASSLEFCTDYKKCIIEPGGCVSCINKNGSEFKKENFYSTTFNDIDMTLGLEKQLFRESEKIFGDNNVIFLETILPQIVGFNETLLENYFLDGEKRNYILTSEDGRDGFKLLKEAYFLILEDILKKYKKGNKTLICGYSNLEKKQQTELLKSLDKEKYIVKIEKELPQKLAVINLEGLVFALVYQKIKKISYEIIYPYKLHFDLKNLDRNKKILILGDPIKILGYKNILEKDFEIKKIDLGFYYPYIKLEDEVTKFFQRSNIKYYNKIDEIIREIDKNTVLICDKQIDRIIKNRTDREYSFFELPYHWLSGYKK